MEATAEAETPRSFIRWAALSALSAVVADRVYLDKFYYKLYPNLYVLLIADSGLRKGFAAALAKTLVTLVDSTRVISGRNSIQAIIKEMSTAVTRPKKAPLTKSHAFIVSGELSTTFVEDPNVFTILTDLHDGHYHTEGWKNTLKGTGVESLKDISVTLLGAVNPPLFRSMITKKDLTGGFIARTVIVEESKRALKNSLITAPVKSLDFSELVEYIREVSKLEGKFCLDPGAAAFFNEWYNDFDPEKMGDETGTANRIHDQILKVAMLMSLSCTHDLTIRTEHLQEAMNLLGHAVKAAGSLGKGSGLTDFAPKIKLVLDEIEKGEGYRILRSVLLNKHWGDFVAAELDIVIATLEQSKAIRILKKGRDEEYIANQSLIDDIEALKNPFN